MRLEGRVSVLCFFFSLAEGFVTEAFVVTFDDPVIRGGCEIRDGVVQGLHFGQETAHRGVVHTSSDVISEFNQGLFVGRVSEFTHVHFEGILFEIIPTFQQGGEGRQPHHDESVFPHRSNHDTRGHEHQRHAVEKSVALFETIKHLSLAPPLFVIEKIQAVQSIQGLGVENRGGMMFIHQTDGDRHACVSACSICFAFFLARRSYSHSSYLKAVSLYSFAMAHTCL